MPDCLNLDRDSGTYNLYWPWIKQITTKSWMGGPWLRPPKNHQNSTHRL